jgi:hypothetical protein
MTIRLSSTSANHSASCSTVISHCGISPIRSYISKLPPLPLPFQVVVAGPPFFSLFFSRPFSQTTRVPIVSHPLQQLSIQRTRPSLVFRSAQSAQDQVIGWQHASSPFVLSFAFESKVPGNAFTHDQLAKPQSRRWRSGAVIELVVGDRREMWEIVNYEGRSRRRSRGERARLAVVAVEAVVRSTEIRIIC